MVSELLSEILPQLPEMRSDLVAERSVEPWILPWLSDIRSEWVSRPFYSVPQVGAEPAQAKLTRCRMQRLKQLWNNVSFQVTAVAKSLTYENAGGRPAHLAFTNSVCKLRGGPKISRKITACRKPSDDLSRVRIEGVVTRGGDEAGMFVDGNAATGWRDDDEGDGVR